MPKRTSIAALVLALAALIAAPALGATGPVGDWQLDEGAGTTVADSSGNGNNGVVSGGTGWVAGVAGTALSFNGSTGQVKVSDNNALEPPKTVTVSAWLRHDGSPGQYRYILAKGGNGCVAASYGLYSGPGGGLEFYVSKERGSVYARSPDVGQRAWDGNWHLAVGTYDGTTIRLYIDGSQVGSGTAWPGSLEYLLPSSNDFYIGNYPGCDHHFLGDIDSVAVWGRALSASEIRSMMPDSTVSTNPSPPAGGQGQGAGGQSTGGGAGSSGSGSGAPTTNGAAPSIRGLKLSTSMVSVDTNGHIVVVARGGLSITYTEANAATLTVMLLRAESGVRRGARCVTPTAKTRRLKRCRHFVVVSRLTHSDRAGRTTLRLDQLLRGRLSPGTYRFDVTPRANGKTGKTVSVRFVVRRSRHR